MKFTVDIDLDWIEEDSSIDDEVKHQIITSIENKVLKKLEEKVLASAQERIESQMTKLITDKIHAMVSEKIVALMSLDRTATDEYGRVTKANFTIESMLIDAVESAVTRKALDKNGRPASGGYGDRPEFSYFEYFATKDIPALIDAKVKALSEAVKKDIEQLVTTKIKTQVADKLTALIVENSTALSLKAQPA